MTHLMKSREFARYRPDAYAISGLLLVIFGVMLYRWYDEAWLSGIDIFNQFLPWFGYIGDRLANLQIPAWNPADSAGYPAAGSGSGGWMYLPIMFAFACFEVITAYKVYVALQLLIGGLSCYALSRKLGLIPFAAMFSGSAFASGQLFYGATVNATASAGMLAFLPLAMLGAEGAIQTHRQSSRISWASITGLSLAQMYAASPPRCVYGVLVVGGWFLYRWLVELPDGVTSRIAILPRLIWTGAIIALFGSGLVAAAALPQIQFVSESSVSGSDYSGLIGGNYASYTFPFFNAFSRLFASEIASGRRQLISSVLVILAWVAILRGKRRFGAPFFAVIFLLFIDLTLEHSLTRWFFYLIPEFRSLTIHRPSAPLLFVSFPACMLAATGIHLIMREAAVRQISVMLKVVPLVVLVVIGGIATTQDGSNWWRPLGICTLATLLLVIAGGVLPVANWRRYQPRLAAAVPLLFLVLVLAYPLGYDIVNTLKEGNSWKEPTRFGTSGYERTRIVMSRGEPGTSAEFMLNRQAAEQPFRYAPYSGNALSPLDFKQTALSAYHPSIIAMLANGRATRLGLEQISGYHPVHFKYLVDYFDVMNASAQDYHYLEVMPAAVSGSQLLDMLNVRYILVPARLAMPPAITTYSTIVYKDEWVTIYENPRAFDRAWIVHDVQPAQDGAELTLFNNGFVDGHTTAFVDGPLPAVSQPETDRIEDFVEVTSYAPEKIAITARSTGDGLLVLSEIYADGWNAYVDGKKVDILRTNHALRGIPLPAGQHEIVVKYEPVPLTLGLWTTAFSSLAMIGAWIWAMSDWRQYRKVSPGG